EQVAASGRSSYMYNQNVFAPRQVRQQGVSLALARSEELLGREGVCRVHGGGFAGTVQAFVPDAMLEDYRREMEAVFGPGSC
ncbi:MAG: galactokinase, partial [Clostridiales bacterium]|nr:galactokinase [Clostridiales bacterium]